MVPMPSRADETAALVRESGRDSTRGASSSSARLVTAAGVLVAFAGVAGVARAVAWSSSPVALGDGEVPPLGGETSASAPATPAPSPACDRTSELGSCSKYAEDARDCAPTTDWSVDSCVQHADSASNAGEPWISAYYACVNGVADDVERPYAVPSARRGKARFLELLHEMEIRDGPRVTPEETSEAAALGVSPLGWEEDDASIDAAASAYMGGIGNDGDERNDEDASKRTSDARTNANDEPYVWAFVHVPKSAGSYVTEVFRAHIWRLRERGDKALARRARVAARVRARQNARANDASELSRRALLDDSGVVGENSASNDYDDAYANASTNVAAASLGGASSALSYLSTNGFVFDDGLFHPLYSGMSYAPVMDLTEPRFRDAFQFYRGAFDDAPNDWYRPGAGAAANQNSPLGMARSFHAGRREIFKGSLAMGFCDAVRAPCGYVTVLRDPIERLLSHHAYSCAAGAEDKAGWTAEMRLKGSCDLDPASYFEQMGGVDVSVQLLAPRANPASRCALEQAKRNLRRPCVRFLLQERLRDGIGKLSATIPGFAGLDEDPPESFLNAPAMGADVGMLSTKNQVAGRLSDAQEARLERWRRDEDVMRRLRVLAHREIELYDFATSEYDKQWVSSGSSVGSC
jgi:hypothetical protein